MIVVLDHGFIFLDPHHHPKLHEKRVRKIHKGLDERAEVKQKAMAIRDEHDQVDQGIAEHFVEASLQSAFEDCERLHEGEWSN